MKSQQSPFPRVNPTPLSLPLLDQPQPQPSDRITHLQKILTDQRTFLKEKTKKIYEDLKKCKKYTEQHKEILIDRIQKTDKFVENISQTFFIMLGDLEYLSLTTQIDLIDKIEKFKKNLFNSLQKITANIDRKGTKLKKHFNSYNQKYDDSSSQMHSRTMQKKNRLIRKSKNSKMSNETSMRMMQWLLKNFDNPYPTTQQKQKMGLESNITVTQVNNWFINARERTIKSYFIKDL